MGLQLRRRRSRQSWARRRRPDADRLEKQCVLARRTLAPSGQGDTSGNPIPVRRHHPGTPEHAPQPLRSRSASITCISRMRGLPLIGVCGRVLSTACRLGSGTLSGARDSAVQRHPDRPVAGSPNEDPVSASGADDSGQHAPVDRSLPIGILMLEMRESLGRTGTCGIPFPSCHLHTLPFTSGCDPHDGMWVGAGDKKGDPCALPSTRSLTRSPSIWSR